MEDLRRHHRYAGVGLAAVILVAALQQHSRAQGFGFGFGGGNQAAGNRRVEIQLRFAF